MRIRYLSILFSLFLLVVSLQANVVFTHTTDADFNSGYLANVMVESESVVLPQQATAMGSWTANSDLPAALQSHKTAYWNQYVYLIGGYNGISTVNKVYYANIGSTIGSWTELTALPVSLQEHEVVVANGYIFVLGGYDDFNPYDTIYKAKLNNDGTIGSWETASVSLPQGLSSFTAKYVDGYLYVVGGSSSSANAVANVYRANVEPEGTLDSFAATSSLPAARSHHSMVSYGNQLFVLGGINNSGDKQNTVYYSYLDFAGNVSSWNSATALPDSIKDHTSTCNNGIITVIGGEKDTITNACYYTNILNTHSFTWNSAPYYNQYLTQAEAVAVNDRVFVLGGYNDVSKNQLINCNYSNLTLSSDRSEQGIYLSKVMNFGYEKLINELDYTMSNSGTGYFDIYYRTAGADKSWSNWNDADQNDPVPINQTDKYLQYMVYWDTGTASHSISLDDVVMDVNGYTEINTDFNASDTLHTVDSPFWVTADVSVNSGTLKIEPGVEILFSEGTGFSINNAELYCVGSAIDSIKFTSFNHKSGVWDGIYFNDNSDDGVASTVGYTAIKNAGYGSRNANLYCDNTTQPNLFYSKISKADGNGIQLVNSDITIDNCDFMNNSEGGIYLNDSEPIITYSESSNNNIGISFSEPAYEIYSGLNLNANQSASIGLKSGYITSDLTWEFYDGKIAVLGNVYVDKSGNKCRLTIEPGNHIALAENISLYIGDDSNDGGELYAEGTSDSTITFSSVNDSVGGSGGIIFRNASDYAGAVSSLKNCIFEKGDSYNIYLENTNSITIDSCLIRNSAGYGLQTLNSDLSLSNTEFTGNHDYPFYTSQPRYLPEMNNVSIYGNTEDCVATESGTITTDKHWKYCGGVYKILGDLHVDDPGSTCRLTLDPGITLEFDASAELHIGDAGDDGGELYAVGTVDSIITFTSSDGSKNNWDGIYFDNASDYGGSVSLMQHCVIENGNDYNIKLYSTNSITIQDSEIRNSVSDGIYIHNSYATLQSLDITNNGQYPIYFNNPYYVTELIDIVTSGNGEEYIAVDNGVISTDRVWRNCGTDYLLLGDLSIEKYNNVCQLTIEPGNTLRFSNGCELHIGDNGNDGGVLIAEGTVDSVITFTSANDSIGGWDGIYLDGASDYYGTVSVLKHCIVENSNDDNVYFRNANNHVIDSCTVRNAVSSGIYTVNSFIDMSNLAINNNGLYPLYFNNPQYVSELNNIVASGNNENYIAIDNGTISTDRTWNYCQVPYLVLGDITVEKYNNICQLTIEPGTTLKFNTDSELHLGDSGDDGGVLIAEGTADSMITFTSANDSIGGWDGIYFDRASDTHSGISTLKNCIIENSSDENIFFDYANNHIIDNCYVRNAFAYGLRISHSNILLSYIDFENNGEYGLYYEQMDYYQ